MMFLGNTTFIFSMLCLVDLDDYASTGFLVPFIFVIIMILIFENTSFIFIIMSVMLQLCKTMFHICFGSIVCIIIMLTFAMNCFCLLIHDFTLLFVALFLWIKINMKMPYLSTFQKRNFRPFSSVGFAGMLKPTPFEGTHYKRWREKALLWLSAMRCGHVLNEQPATVRSDEDEQAWGHAETMCKAALLSIINDSLVDAYIPLPTGRAVWEALEARYGLSDAGSELYIMEQFHDYKMVDNRPVVEQAHEIQGLVKELELYGCPLPDRFVAGCIIAKLPPSWTDFATTLKHKRQQFSIAELVGTLDVEDKARAKDVKGKSKGGNGEATTSAHVVQKFRPKPQKKKPQQELKQKSTTFFKKGNNKKMGLDKAKMNCFTCGNTGHFSRECPEAKWKPPPKAKTVNTIETDADASGYGNLSAFTVCSSPDWWVDTGANIHVCADKSLFSFYQVGRSGALLMGNGARAGVHGVGTVDLKLTSGKTVQLKNVHHVPSIRKNLISGSLLCRDGFKLVFESNKCVMSKYGTFVGKGYESGGLFRLSLVDTLPLAVNNVVNNVNVEMNVWHSRLCHVNLGCMSRLAVLNLIPKFDVAKSSKCHTCVEAKQPRKPHKAAVARELAPLELIHSDICEMNGILTKGGKRYFITFIDDCTRYCYVYLIKTKDEALHYFKTFKAEAENQLEKHIKRLRSDRGGEYFSNEFSEFCAVHGIIHERTPPYSPQSNGIAERKNRTLTDLVNAMLETAGLSKEWWGEAILTANHVLNRVPTKNKEITPFEEWEKKRLNISYLRVWGCLAKVNVPINKKRKLGPKTVDCVFLGYAIHSVGYRFLIINSSAPDMAVGTVMESRDATFFENEFPMKIGAPSVSSHDSVPEFHESNIHADDNTHELEQNPEEDDNTVTRRSKRQRVAKSFGEDFIIYLVDDTPTTVSEAYSSPDSDMWKEAVQSEMDSIMSNGTWEVVDRPFGCKPVGCKWVFKKKLRPDGTIEKYKARLVAKGYTQKEGEDYFDTYSPVARLTTIRVLLSLAASHDLFIHQMDVKTAFLNGELEEEIYMDQPDGFIVNGQEGKVCKLLKSLYGLKQAPKQWHEKFDKTLTSAGFVVNEADKCVYYRFGGGDGVILCLYVDDILIFGNNLNVIKEVKEFLSSNFEMKDLGEADVILNIKLSREEGNGGVTLMQSHYVEKVLNRFGYSECTPAPTPYDPSVHLRKNHRIARDQLRYSQIIGSLMYLASATRPDISFAVSKLSRFVSNPGDTHWNALERVLRYLKGTMSYSIHFSGYPRVLEGYCDANWISDADQLYATSGYVFLLGGGAVSWKSCKQTILTKSTMEAELTALDTASAEAEWLRDLLMDLPIVEKPIPAISMNCDNQTVITKVNSSKDNMKSTKHVKRRLKTVRKLRNSGVIALDYVHTSNNLADQFTKGLSRNVIEGASRELGLRPT